MFRVIRLIGVKCTRDAVGTNVIVTSAEPSRTRQRTAGDGDQASTERILIFELADADPAEEVLIRWPSGSKQCLSNLLAGSTELSKDEVRPHKSRSNEMSRHVVLAVCRDL